MASASTRLATSKRIGARSAKNAPRPRYNPKTCSASWTSASLPWNSTPVLWVVGFDMVRSRSFPLNKQVSGQIWVSRRAPAACQAYARRAATPLAGGFPQRVDEFPHGNGMLAFREDVQQQLTIIVGDHYVRMSFRSACNRKFYNTAL